MYWSVSRCGSTTAAVPASWVSNKVGSVRQARQIKLLEDQVALTFFAESCAGWGTIRK
jgi:hypothetical protein